MAAKSTKGARDAFMPSSNAFGESRPLVVPDSAKPPPVLQSSELQEKFAGDLYAQNSKLNVRSDASGERRVGD